MEEELYDKNEVENRQEREEETEGDTEDDTEDETEDESSNGSIPSELLKSYSFGFGSCHPKWLQIFANRKFFTIILCVYAVLEGAVVSGMTSVNLTTIEKRYHLTSTAAGFIPVAFDVTVTLCVVFVSYFGGRGHKPRCLGVCFIIMSIGCFVFAAPQFLLGPYKVGNNHGYLNEVCNDTRSYPGDDCTPSDNIAFTMFLLGKVLLGIGASPLYTVAQAYLDEIVYPRYITVYMGIYHTMGIVGPVFGYGIGSVFLSVYVDPWINTSLRVTDAAWVGAWWISFVIVGVLSFIGAIPFLMFPRYLAESRTIYEERSREMAKLYTLTADRSSLKDTLRMFPVHIKRLIFNPSFMLCSFSLGGLYLLTNGLVVFGPQYIENVFFVLPTKAGLISGGVSVVVAVFGVLTGALILYFFKIKERKIMLLCFVITLIAVPVILGLLVRCPTPSIVGINTFTHDTNGSIITSGIDSPSCAKECNCLSHVYEPVCGSDGLTYFSPCRAGCTTNTINGYSNCSCVQFFSSNDTNNNNVKNYNAEDGICDNNCHLLIPFIVGVSIVLGMVFMVQIPIYYFTIRVVSDESRSLALGVQSVIWRSVGAIPGPVIAGVIFDVSCIYWEESCGSHGNCWLYDSKKLSTGIISFMMPVMAIVSVLFLSSCLTFKKESYDMTQSAEEDTSWHTKLTGFFTKDRRVEVEEEEPIIDSSD